MLTRTKRYSVEVGGVGISSKPSYYPSENPDIPPQPVYATSTALFRLGAAGPARSPRSVRTTELPFMPGSSQSSHPHNLAGKYLHTRTAPTSHHSQRLSPSQVREVVQQTLQSWQTGEVSLTELWGSIDVAGACAGSKRYLVGCLGGYGDVDAIEQAGEFAVIANQQARGLRAKWEGFKPDEPALEASTREWGEGKAVGDNATPGQGGW